MQYTGSRSNDTLTIALARPRELQGVAIAIYFDEDCPNGQCACPSRIVITDKYGKTLATEDDFSAECLPNDVNITKFDQVISTDTINLNFFTQPGRSVGVTEVQFWIPGIQGPEYYAVDALPTTSDGDRFDTANFPAVRFDQASKTFPNGAVMHLKTSQSALLFSGLKSDEGNAKMTLSYANKGDTAVNLSVALNRVVVGSVDLVPTVGSNYSEGTLPAMNLAKGNNFIRLSGGGDEVFVESIRMN